jgi:hypothetical protein
MDKITTNKNNPLTVSLAHVNLLELEDALFLPDSSIMLPLNASKGLIDANISGIRALGLVFKQFEFDATKRMVVVGHTDQKATPQDNFKLSTERADNVLWLILGDQGEWAENCTNRQTIRLCKQLIRQFAAIKMWNIDPGQGDDDTWDDKVKVATGEFIKKCGFPADDANELLSEIFGDANKKWTKKLWVSVYSLYEEQLSKYLNITKDDLDKQRQLKIRYLEKPFLLLFSKGIKAIGCGNSVPLSSLTADDKKDCNYTSTTNTRVEILFFVDEAEFTRSCLSATTQNHNVTTECPLWNPKIIRRHKIPVEDLTAVVYHLQFRYFNVIKNETVCVPAGLEAGFKAYEPDNTNPGAFKEVPCQTTYTKEVYLIKVQIDKTRTGIHFSFTAGANTWIFTDTKATETILQSPVDNATLACLTPGDPNFFPPGRRMKYYDIPSQWSSQNYWTRYGKDLNKGDRFTNVVKDTLKLIPYGGAITDIFHPLVFNLDDLVLVDGTGSQAIQDKDDQDTPINLSADSRYTLFNVENGCLIRYNLGDPVDNDGPVFTNEAFSENLILNCPNGSRLISFSNGFYDITDRRSGNHGWPFDASLGQIQGCRAALLNDKRFHFWEELKYSSATMNGNSINSFLFFAKQSGNFELHFIHNVCEVPNPENQSQKIIRSFMVIYWSGRFKPHTYPHAADPDKYDDIVIGLDHAKKFAKDGCLNACHRWEEKGYTVEPPDLMLAPQIMPVFFFEAKKDNTGGKEKCTVKISNDNSAGEMGIVNSHMYYNDYHIRDYLSVGNFRDIDGKKFKTLVVAHEFSHALGKDDEYAYDNKFKQYYPGMPYHFDDGSMMTDNRAPRMKHLWFFVNWINDRSNTPAQLLPFLNHTQYKIVHRFNGKKLSYSLPIAPNDHRCIYWPFRSVNKQTVGNVGGNKSVALHLYKLGEDEAAYNIRIGGQRPNFAFRATLMVTINMKIKFENAAAWSDTQVQKCISRLQSVFKNDLNGKFYLINDAHEHPFKYTYIHFFPLYQLNNDPSDATYENYEITFFLPGTLDPLNPPKGIKADIYQADNLAQTLNISASVDNRWIAHWALGNYQPQEASFLKQLFNLNKVGVSQLGFIKDWFCSAPIINNLNFQLRDHI